MFRTKYSRTFAPLGPIPRFPLGEIAFTQGVEKTIEPKDILPALCDHSAGKWRTEETEANEYGLLHRSRILTQWNDSAGKAFFIVTNLAESKTIVVLPDEYGKQASW